MAELIDIDQPLRPRRRIVVPAFQPIPDGRKNRVPPFPPEARLKDVQRRIATAPTGTPEYMALAAEAEDLERQVAGRVPSFGQQVGRFGEIATAPLRTPEAQRLGEFANVGPLGTPEAQRIGFALGKGLIEPPARAFLPRGLEERLFGPEPEFYRPPGAEYEVSRRTGQVLPGGPLPTWQKALEMSSVALPATPEGYVAANVIVPAFARAGAQQVKRGAVATGRELVESYRAAPEAGFAGAKKVPKKGEPPGPKPLGPIAAEEALSILNTLAAEHKAANTTDIVTVTEFAARLGMKKNSDEFASVVSDLLKSGQGDRVYYRPSRTAIQLDIDAGTVATPKTAEPYGVYGLTVGKIAQAAEPIPPSVAKAAPAPPATTGAGSGAGNLGRIRTALQKPQKKPIDWGDLYLKAQERLNDATFGLRRMQSRLAGRAPILPGSSQDIKTSLNTAPGAANAGYTRYRVAVSDAAKAAPGAKVSDIDVVLFSEHGKNILREKGAARVLPGGVNTPEGLDQALAALEREIGSEKYQQVRKAAEIIRDTYARERERLIAEGLISPELGSWLKIHYPWYNPLRYMEYVDEQAAKGLAARPISVTESGLRRLSEVGSEDAILHPLGALGQQLIRNEVRIRKNKLAKGIIEVALQDTSLGVTKRAGPFPPGDIPGTISFFENGERQVYDVPQWMAWETSVLNRGMAHPVVALIGALNGVSKAAFTSYSPVFTAANIFNDMIPAFVRGGVLPTETAAQIARSLKPLEQDVLRQAFALTGAKQTRFYGKDAEALAKAVGASGGTVIGKHTDLSKLLRDMIPTAGELGEQAPRTVVFRKYLDKHLPSWKGMTAEQIAATPQARAAASAAVEATINFHRGGYWVQSANPFVIFLNAAMEGSKLPYRALAESPRARWTTAGIGAGVMGLTAYNMTYPEYFDVPDNVRRGSIMVMLPSRRKDEQGNPIPRYVTIIPNTREWAMFFGTLSYGMEKVLKDSPESFWEFARVMIPQVSPVTNMPIPQPALEAVQQVTNYDIYRGRPIVSQSQAQVPAAEQTGPYVSSTVQKLASKSGLSPVRMQHVMDTLFGGAGAAALSVTDMAVGVKNPRGLALKMEYEQIPPDERPTWLAKHSAADKGALRAAMRQTGANIPVVSPMLARFYRERGGQIEQDKWERLRKGTVAQEQLNNMPELKRLGIRFTGVGTQVAGRELTLDQRNDYQARATEIALEAVVKTTRTAYYSGLNEDNKKKLIQRAMDGARETARQEIVEQFRPARQQAEPTFGIYKQQVEPVFVPGAR